MAGNPYTIQPALSSADSVFKGLGSIIKQNRQEQKATQKKKEFMGALESGDPNKMAEFVINNPDSREIVNDLMKYKSTASKKNHKDTLRNILTDPQNAEQHMQSRVDYLNSVGASTDIADRSLDLAVQGRTDPSKMETFLKGAEVSFAGVAPKEFKALQADAAGAAGAGSSEREFNNLIKNFSEKDKKRARRVKAGLEGRATGSAAQTIAKEGTTEEVGKSEADIAEAKEEATGATKGRQQRLNNLREAKAGRQGSLLKANKFLDLLKTDKLSTGAGRKGASYIPGVYTKQGELDEEFNAFSEIAARQALKASGELRPTDADVEGMKRAMFGIGRDEKVNIQLLEDYIRQQESDEDEYFNLLRGRNAPQEPVQPPNIDELLKKYAN